MAAKKSQDTAEITAQPLRRASARLRIIGQTPLFQNRMAAKAKQQLLVGGRKKGKADRVTIKHDPLTEFRDSAEILPGGPTALGLRVVAVKAAMATAALAARVAARAPRGRPEAVRSPRRSTRSRSRPSWRPLASRSASRPTT